MEVPSYLKLKFQIIYMYYIVTMITDYQDRRTQGGYMILIIITYV